MCFAESPSCHYIRFGVQTQALDCDLWPLRPAGRQTDPGSRAEDQASSDTECFQHHRGGLSPAVPYAQELPGTAAGGAAHWIIAGHFIAELESVQHDDPFVELAPAKIDGKESTQKGVEKEDSGKDKEGPVASWSACLFGEKRAGREWPGLVGRFLTHRLWWELKGQGELTPHSWTIQVLVPRRNQKGALAQEAQEQTGPTRTNSERPAGAQEREWKIFLPQSRPACGL